MKIDIQEIVSNTIKELEEKRTLESLIKDNIQKAVKGAVDDAVNGYKIKRMLEEKIESQVSSIVKDIGFTAYNSFIAEQVQSLMQSVFKEDLAKKVSTLFENIMINKRETIKLSEIIKAYKELYEDMDYDDWRDLDEGRFYVNFDDDDDGGSFRHITLVMAQETQKRISSYSYSGNDTKKLKLRLMIYKNEGNIASISSIEFEDKKLSDLNQLRYMSNFEAMLVNLYFNKTKVEVDIDDEDDIDNYIEGYED